jgi:cytoskeletal protein RodZ
MATVFSDDAKRGRGSPARTQKDEGPGIGELLRGARECHGLTLEQVSRQTRIPRKHLEALEHDKLAPLPPFYQRAEIRTYARAVNLDPGLVLAQLERGPVVPDGSPTLHKPGSSRNHRAVIASLFVLTAIVLWRATPPDLSRGVETWVGQVADSTRTIVSPPGKPATPAPVGTQPTVVDRNATAALDRASAADAGIEPAEARPTVGAPSDLPITAPRVDDRPSVALPTELVVTTQPAGARVTVDGIGWGVTPVTIRYLAPGIKRIRVSKEGYASIEREVSVVEGRRKTTDIRLEDAP